MINDVITGMTREQLAQLGREYMLAAQFNSRTGYAALQMNHGPEAYLDTAIDNWMAVSPIYTQRMQRAMRTNTGSDVAAILKGMQLECGLSHQYFDAGFELVSEDEGYFWLNSCGPLLETEPRGEAAVKTMCHDIEDPTFDATAVATNPRARIRPVHRPPRRVPAERAQHCKWHVMIDPDAEPVVEPDVTGVMRETLLADLVIARLGGNEEGGLDYYDGPVFETLQLERFSQSALVVICKELAVQIQLLVNSLSLAVAQRYGEEAATAIALFQMTGGGWVTSERLARHLGYQDGGIDAIADVLRIHPAFQPREYFGLEVDRYDEQALRLKFHSAPVDQEERTLGWYPLLQAGQSEGLEAIVRGVDKRARVIPEEGQDMVWRVCLVEDEAESEAEEEPLAVQIAKGTVLYQTKLENHLQLIELT